MCRFGDLIDVIYEGSFIRVMEFMGELKLMVGCGFCVDLGVNFFGGAGFVQYDPLQIL